MVEWLTEHSKSQSKLSINKYEVNQEEVIEMVEILGKNGLYDMILILIYEYRHNA